MVGKKIIWSSKAESEFIEILAFYNQRNQNKEYSRRLLSEVEDLMEILKDHPFLGRLCDNKMTRVIVMQSYLVFYEVSEEQIRILSFWDSRQDPKNQPI